MIKTMMSINTLIKMYYKKLYKQYYKYYKNTYQMARKQQISFCQLL